MKKVLLIILACLLVVTLCACSGNKASKDPLVSKWVRLFDDGNAKALFSVEEIGDLDVTVWRKSAVSGELEQTEDYAGSYTADKENCVIKLTIDESVYELPYALVENETLTITYEGVEYEFDHVGSNQSAD